LWSQAVAEDFGLAPPREARTDGSECIAEISAEETRELWLECRGGLLLESANQIAIHGMRCNVSRTRSGSYSHGLFASKGKRPSRSLARLRVLSNQISKIL
jgi:hypothetical protein